MEFFTSSGSRSRETVHAGPTNHIGEVVREEDAVRAGGEAEGDADDDDDETDIPTPRYE